MQRPQAQQTPQNRHAICTNTTPCTPWHTTPHPPNHTTPHHTTPHHTMSTMKTTPHHEHHTTNTSPPAPHHLHHTTPHHTTHGHLLMDAHPRSVSNSHGVLSRSIDDAGTVLVVQKAALAGCCRCKGCFGWDTWNGHNITCYQGFFCGAEGGLAAGFGWLRELRHAAPHEPHPGPPRAGPTPPRHTRLWCATPCAHKCFTVLATVWAPSGQLRRVLG